MEYGLCHEITENFGDTVYRTRSPNAPTGSWWLYAGSAKSTIEVESERLVQPGNVLAAPQSDIFSHRVRHIELPAFDAAEIGELVPRLGMTRSPDVPDKRCEPRLPGVQWEGNALRA